MFKTLGRLAGPLAFVSAFAYAASFFAMKDAKCLKSAGAEEAAFWYLAIAAILMATAFIIGSRRKIVVRILSAIVVVAVFYAFPLAVAGGYIDGIKVSLCKKP